MKLNSEQQLKLMSKFEEDVHPSNCELCQNNNWNVNDTLFEIREFHGGDTILGGDSKILPMITISCGKCGNTKFLNAIKLNIVDSNNPKGLSDKEGTDE